MSHRILVVDDNDDTCEVMRLYLTIEGFTVIVARDGNEGSEAAVRESPDLIITDARMPNLDGIEMTRQLRAQSRFKQLPIIIVTGFSSGLEREAWQAGANEVFIKPVSPDSLVTRIRDLLS
jgi:DNA-binding response OmpR family regulator